MSTSVLKTPFQPAKRPYSQKELHEMQKQLYDSLKLSDIYTYHKECGHWYRVRRGGRKETEMKNTNSQSSGNCSVCHSLRKTPDDLWEVAQDLVQTYQLHSETNELTYTSLSTERSFYTWLYSR